MTLDALYNQYKGQSILSFDGDPNNNGQCEQWALMVRTKRDGLPIRYGNAIDWWKNRGSDPQHYDYIPFAKGVYPKYGDYVVWGTGVGSSAGHIDLCAQDGNAAGFVGYDSNWLDIPKLTTVVHDYSYGILGYIRVKENSMPNAGDVDNVYLEFNGRKATDQEKQVYTNKSWSAGDGLYYGKVAVEVQNLKKALAAAQQGTDPKLAALAKALKDVVIN